MSGLMENKVAIVTGGSSGIGKKTSIKFASEGAKVIVADIQKNEGEKTVRLIKEAGGEAFFIDVDVSREKDTEKMVELAVDKYGKLDCAFNNAGKLTAHKTEWTETPVELFDELIHTNLKGVWLCMKYELRAMLTQGYGCIVNNSSIGGVRGGGGEIYVASKHGVLGLTRNAALRYGHQGIRVNAVGPGIIATETYLEGRRHNPSNENKINPMIPLGRVGTTEEVAATVTWLCSDISSYMTGSILMLDGGLSETDSAHWEAQRQQFQNT